MTFTDTRISSNSLSSGCVRTGLHTSLYSCGYIDPSNITQTLDYSPTNHQPDVHAWLSPRQVNSMQTYARQRERHLTIQSALHSQCFVDGHGKALHAQCSSIMQHVERRYDEGISKRCCRGSGSGTFGSGARAKGGEMVGVASAVLVCLGRVPQSLP